MESRDPSRRRGTVELTRSLLRSHWGIFWLALGLIVVGQAMDGLGIGFILPLIHEIAGDAGGTEAEAMAPSALERATLGILDTFGISLSLAPVLVFICILALLRAVFLFIGEALGAYMSSRYRQEAQGALYESVLAAEYTFLLERRQGHLANILIGESIRVSAAIGNLIALFGECLAIATYVTVALLIDWKMALGATALSGLAYLALVPVIRAGRVQARSRQRAENELQSLIQESLASIASMKAMAAERPFRREYRRLIDGARVADLRRGVQAAFLTQIPEPVGILIICGVVLSWARFVGGDPGAFVLLLVVLYRTFRRLTALPKRFHAITSNLPSFEIMESWRERARAAAELDGGETLADGFRSLRMRGVTYAYKGSVPVVEGVDLDVERGEMIALVGPSGAGKTTLIGLVLGFFRRYGGEVRINDRSELARLSLSDWRGRIGYVGQGAQLFNGTVAENIAFFEDVPRDRVRTAAEDAFCTEFIDEMDLGFETQVGDRGTRLSGGQRQRIVLARALLRCPEILILDEATSDLDAASEKRIQESIQRHRGRITILVIAHRLSTIRSADRIYCLSGGRVVESGSCEDLLARGGEFARLYRIQMDLAPAERVGKPPLAASAPLDPREAGG